VLTELTKGGKRGKLIFDDVQRAAFEELKAKLCSSTALGTPDYTRPFQIQTDASDHAVAGCLTQRTDDGVERPLGFASAKLTDVQRRWSTIEKEAYAVVFSLQKFEHIVYASHMDIFTDHNPLVYIKNNSVTCNKLTCWALHLSRYDISVHHKKGVDNSNDDYLIEGGVEAQVNTVLQTFIA